MDTAFRRSASEDMAGLLQQIREGSLEAFDRFYEAAAPFVMGLSCKLLGDRMEAEDVCHDVLMLVIAQPERYDPARGTVEAWLAVLTKSRCMDRLRKRRRVVLESESPGMPERIFGASEEIEGRVLTKLEKEALRRAMGELPGTQRQTLAAAFFDSRSRRELAETWQVPIGTVKSRVRYGLSHLRKAMAKLGWAEAEGGGSLD
ncbi:sigma-70 family RNA polymerase sigma factor [Cohnella sp. CFH 77786]|uniref:RNA polymerase sigma factor n=1 Tax=Cohnella sp. CFH 77786 TaxID=2662265 RepID=UPI001C60AA62|nr:sigma-70 family RNA polymerase sigma factor [Cohnella sp. CFH 77786]MBW5446728.1 sigma-70 family RNA polymerase sigma factor [Cohnella sp. CFH 77786]